MALLLDAGGLIGFDRRNLTVIALIEAAQRQQIPVRTTTGVVAQVWRDGSRQARLARLLRGVDERELSVTATRRVGVLLKAAQSADVIDASLIDIALDGDEVVTSDPDDLVRLAAAAGKRITVLTVSA
jgi:hypothetical protein